MSETKAGPKVGAGAGPRAGVAILGLPWDRSSSYLTGPALAPPLIREAFRSDSANTWTEYGLDLGAEGVVHDAGDLDLATGADPWESITDGAARLFDDGYKPIFLGGDHSVTHPLVRAAARFHPGLSILHLDAHPDLYHDFQGDPRSHASPMARIMEEGLVQRLVQVGIRTAVGEQREQAQRFGVEMVEMKDLGDGYLPSFSGPVYLSLDLDVLDPAFAPGVSHLEPGGMSTRRVLDLIHNFKSELIGADIVEYNPRRDINGLTAMVAAKLFKEIAARMLDRPGMAP